MLADTFGSLVIVAFSFFIRTKEEDDEETFLLSSALSPSTSSSPSCFFLRVERGAATDVESRPLALRRVTELDRGDAVVAVVAAALVLVLVVVVVQGVSYLSWRKVLRWWLSECGVEDRVTRKPSGATTSSRRNPPPPPPIRPANDEKGGEKGCAAAKAMSGAESLAVTSTSLGLGAILVTATCCSSV